jgi:hypothetical protein
MAEKPKRARTLRREEARATVKLAKDRERLFEAEPGGSPGRPVAVDSAGVVEIRAAQVPCPRCDGEQVVDEHVAVSRGGDRLREARLRCRRCGTRRSFWFRLPVVN